MMTKEIAMNRLEEKISCFSAHCYDGHASEATQLFDSIHGYLEALFYTNCITSGEHRELSSKVWNIWKKTANLRKITEEE